MAADALGPQWQQINHNHSFVTEVICLLERIKSSEINFCTGWLYSIKGITADLCPFESLLFIDLFQNWLARCDIPVPENGNSQTTLYKSLG